MAARACAFVPLAVCASLSWGLLLLSGCARKDESSGTPSAVSSSAPSVDAPSPSSSLSPGGLGLLGRYGPDPYERPPLRCKPPKDGVPSDEDVIIAYGHEGGIGYPLRDLFIQRNRVADYYPTIPLSNPSGFPRDPCGPARLSQKTIDSFLALVEREKICEHAPQGEPTWEALGIETLCIRVEGKTCFVGLGDSKDPHARAVLNAIAGLAAFTCTSKLPLPPRR